MKRAFVCSLVVGIMAIGLVGCGEKAEVKKVNTTTTPGGTTTKTDSTKIETTGDNPPAPAK